jgi:hypothetical protein
MKTICIALLTLLITGFFAATALADGNWEISISVSSGNAENRLALGQNQDATNQKDGLYDVPAMLSGALRAWFTSSGRPLWRDIRSTVPGDTYEWQLQISSRTGLPAMVSWDPEQFPTETTVELIDNTTGTVIDMSSTDNYLLENSSEAELKIKIY